MPLLDIFWSMLGFFLFIAWMWMLISIFGDIFSSDMSGWGKAGWSLFVIVLPLLGSLIYLIVNGGAMQERSARAAVAADQAQRDYIRSVAASSTSVADEIGKLAALRDQGTISDQEFQTMKAQLIAS
jgi:hypothetical protein